MKSFWKLAATVLASSFVSYTAFARTCESLFLEDSLASKIESVFHRTPVDRDFDVAYAAAATYLTLPSNHGVAATVATLRAETRKYEKQKYFGLVKNEPKYSKESLGDLVRVLVEWMGNTGVSVESAVKAEHYWMQRHENTELVPAFLDRLNRLRADPKKEPISSFGEADLTKVRFDVSAYRKAASQYVNYSRVYALVERLQEALAPVVAEFPGHQVGRLLEFDKPAPGVLKKEKRDDGQTIFFVLKGPVVYIKVNARGGAPLTGFAPMVRMKFGKTPDDVLDVAFFWYDVVSFPRLSQGLIPAPELDPRSGELTKARIEGIDQFRAVILETAKQQGISLN